MENHKIYISPIYFIYFTFGGMKYDRKELLSCVRTKKSKRLINKLKSALYVPIY